MTENTINANGRRGPLLTPNRSEPTDWSRHSNPVSIVPRVDAMQAASPGRATERRTWGRGLRILKRRAAEYQEAKKAEAPEIQSPGFRKSGRAVR
jgi:hypothetical protein